MLIGPGDDAALLQLAALGQCVVTTDMVTDGVDFHLSEIDPRRAGYKALAVNLSDLAAMAAKPVAVVVSVVLPKSGGFELGKSICEGMLPLAEKHGVAMAGGDVNTWDGPLAISITAIGEPTSRGPLLRSGAKPGDRILVTGRFGGSILSKHLDFEPRVHEALLLHERYDLHAGMDCSDGLSLDLSRLAKESGCGAAVDLQKIPIADDAVRLSKQTPGGPRPLDHALADGEDFELILAVERTSAAKLIADQPLAPLPITDIGHFVDTAGLWAIDGDRLSTLEARGFEHR